jgi:peroxiredoxin/predicted 2-oxoglutarate/Fe(II)-dependent dioxygenase YbiX
MECFARFAPSLAGLMLLRGDPAPVFVARAPGKDHFVFDTVAGRYVVLCFFVSAGRADMAALHRAFRARADLFDDRHASFFGISADPADEAQGRVAPQIPGFRLFWDFDRAIGAAYGLAEAGAPSGRAAYRACTVVLDPRLRVLAVLPVLDPATHAAEAIAFVERLPRLADPGRVEAAAPVLCVPDVFEPELCRALIADYAAAGGEDSGFMRSDAQGRTVLKVDYGHKRRRDHPIEAQLLRDAIRARIQRRLVPEIEKAFQFKATRIERYIVACYDSDEGGYFRPHRDNTTKGTAHRRFAVTLNLNAEDYEGGDLRFPEFGLAAYRAPTGGAVIFSCSLLHEATPVTAGRRYAVLPFLYDEAAAKIREANLQFLADEELRDSIAKGMGKS